MHFGGDQSRLNSTENTELIGLSKITKIFDGT